MESVFSLHDFRHTQMLQIEEVPHVLEASGIIVDAFVDLHDATLGTIWQFKDAGDRACDRQLIDFVVRM